MGLGDLFDLLALGLDGMTLERGEEEEARVNGREDRGKLG